MPQTFGWREWKKYAGAMKWHLQTTFGFKALLIRLHGIIKVNWLGIPSARGVLIGKDGWYFLRGERIIDDYCGWVPFTDDELGQWKQVLEAREKWFAERGIVYLFLIAPDKHSVYEEYLPDAIARGRGSTRLGQLTEFLQQNSESWTFVQHSESSARNSVCTIARTPIGTTSEVLSQAGRSHRVSHLGSPPSGH